MTEYLFIDDNKLFHLYVMNLVKEKHAKTYTNRRTPLFSLSVFLSYHNSVRHSQPKQLEKKTYISTLKNISFISLAFLLCALKNRNNMNVKSHCLEKLQMILLLLTYP